MSKHHRQETNNTFRSEVDPDQLPLTVLELYRIKQGELVSALMHLGTRLGLWRALADNEPCNSTELASATGLQERWIREWLEGVASTDLVQHRDGCFALTPEAKVALTDSTHWAYMPEVFGPPMTHGEIEATLEAFRTGIGVGWADHGEHTCHMQSAMSAAKQQAFLVPVILAAFDGAVDRLRQGGTIVDVGCGSGAASLLLAQAFPAATVLGIDPSDRAIAKAQEAGDGLDNLRYVQGTFDDLKDIVTNEAGGVVDLLVTLDVLHDLPRPTQAAAAAYECLSPAGWWLVADIKTRGDLEANRKIPVLPYMYAMSVFYCMSSSLSEPEGAGLGTLGLTPERLQAMTDKAGFSRFKRHDIDVDPTNWYYEIRH